jgi:hypothetical protein
MPKVIVVVARDRPELLAYFEEVFHGMEDIKVIVDRRILPPGATLDATTGQGQLERRDVYDDLRQRGFVMIRLR